MLRTDPRLTDVDAATHVARFLHDRRSWTAAPDAGVVAVRRRTQKQRLPDDDIVSTVDVRVPTRSGSIAGRWYVPSRPATTAALFLHGGGWTIGDLEMNDALVRELVARSGSVVLSIDYRLAPEHAHPAALEDSLDAMAWLRSQRPATDRIVVAGHSAGGNLAAVVAQVGAVGGAEPVDGQLLLCPVVDCDLSRGSYDVFGEGLLLTREEMQWYWDLYQPDPERRAGPSSSPLRSPDLAALPPTTIVVAGADPLHDEAVEYAEQLRRHSVAVTLHVQPGVPHLYLTFPPMPGRDESLDVAATALL